MLKVLYLFTDKHTKLVRLLPNGTVATVCTIVEMEEPGEDNSRDGGTNDAKEKSIEHGIDEEVNQGTQEEKLNSNDHGKGNNYEERNVLIQYNYSGNKLSEITLDECPDSMAVVTLGDRTCLALSYRWV